MDDVLCWQTRCHHATVEVREARPWKHRMQVFVIVDQESLVYPLALVHFRPNRPCLHSSSLRERTRSFLLSLPRRCQKCWAAHENETCFVFACLAEGHESAQDWSKTSESMIITISNRFHHDPFVQVRLEQAITSS